MNNGKNDIDELIARSLTGETSPEDEQRLATWLAQSKDNSDYYQKLKKVTTLADHYYQSKATLPEVNLDQEWNQFLNQVGENKSGRVFNLQSSTWLRIAASLLLIVASGFIINYVITSRQTMVVETAAAMQEVTLPDGSQITLNHNSKLIYQPSFGKTNRSVTLQGEAFFDVFSDETKPFIISVNETTIEVVGTSFNIRGYPSTEKVEVVVATGTVKFKAKDQQVTLRAGDKGVYSSAQNTLVNQTNYDINFMAWKTRKIIFQEAGLREVIETLNNVYQANITLAAPISDTCLVTVSFDQQSLDAVLNVLKTTLNLEYRIQNGQIEITHAGC